MSSSFHKALYRPIAKAAVMSEYGEASAKSTEYEKAKWGSEESMLNRFRLGLSVVDWTTVMQWLDVGCGTGLFFHLVEEAGYRFHTLVGSDITRALLAHARTRIYQNPTYFIESDLEVMPITEARFDLVTLVGVLQQCGVPPEQAIAACIRPLKPGGQFFLTTKHLGWKAFTEGELTPEPSHSWFIYEEISSMIDEIGVEITKAGGFLPRQGKVVALEESHTLFILGTKGK